jgi:lipopolysaccharide transport system permease protein
MHQTADVPSVIRAQRAEEHATTGPDAPPSAPAEGEAPDTRPVAVIRPPSFTFSAFASGMSRISQYGDLLYTLSAHRLNVRYKQSMLGPMWAILQPLALMLIYTLVFSVFARVPSEGVPYALFAYCALLPWTYFATGVSTATNSLVSHANLVTKVYFPREILPLTYIIAAFVDFLAASVVLGLLMMFYGVSLTWQVLYVVPIVAILTIFAFSVALVLSAIQVRYRDIGLALPLALQFGMFATPVIYPLSLVPAEWRWLYALNPMAAVVESFRRVVIQGAPPVFDMLALAALASLLLLPAAYVYFKHVEATVADLL